MEDAGCSRYEQFWLPQDNGLTSVDLFSGSGGLSLGLHTIGWNGLFAIEKDAMAFETLRQNFLVEGRPFRAFREWPAWLPQREMGIEELLASQMMRRRLERLRGEVDLVAGGPPCQGFSVGGARRGENDVRNDLPYQFVEAVELIQPRMVLLENVEGFDRPFTHQGHRESYADLIRAEFEKRGYSTIKMTAHAVEYGVPQTRKRVVLFGMRGDVDRVLLHKTFTLLLRSYAADFQKGWLPESSFPITVAEALDDLNGARRVPTPDLPKFESPVYVEPASEYARLMRAFVGSAEVADSHRLVVHTEKVRHLFEVAHATQRPGRLSRQFLIGMGTLSRKKVLVDPEAPSTTVTSLPDEFIHHRDPRILTLRETARLQAFPDAFTFHGRYTLNGDRRGLDVSRCAQVGNAIPPLLGRALGYAVANIADATSHQRLTSITADLNDFEVGQLAFPMLAAGGPSESEALPS